MRAFSLAAFASRLEREEVFIGKGRIMHITLKDARRHLNIDDETFTDDDGYILSAIEAAEGAVSGDLDRPLGECVDPRTGELAAPLRQAVLLHVGSLYSHRESVGTLTLKGNPLYDMLIGPWRRQSVR